MTKKTTAEMFPRLLERKKLKEQAAAKAAASTIADDGDEQRGESGPATEGDILAKHIDQREPAHHEAEDDYAISDAEREGQREADLYFSQFENEDEYDFSDMRTPEDVVTPDDSDFEYEKGNDGEADGSLPEVAVDFSTSMKAKLHTNAARSGKIEPHRPYPIDAFGKFAAVIKLIAAAVQVDLEMVGSSLLGVIAALAQGLINVSHRATDSGCPVTVNMFVIAPSGERKSSTIDKIIKPVYDAIRRAQDERKHMIVQDVTVDGLIVGLIARCPVQFCLVLEGASLLGGHAMSRDNLSRFLGNVASLYSGEPISRTRVNEHHYAQDRRLNVLLFTQPIVAMEFLSSEMVMQQGMGNRFLYSQPPSLMGQRQHTDIELEDKPVYQKFCAKITELANMVWKINPDSGGIDNRTVRMTTGAKAAWVAFYNKLEFAAGPGGKLAPHAGYVTRFPEQVMRIAALLAMLEDPTVEHISEDIMVRAIELGEYYLDSAMSVFDLTPANKDEADAKTLLNWMQNKADDLDMEAIPVRMMYKDGPRCARPSKRTKELLAILVARGEIVEFDDAIHYDKKNSYDNYAIVSA